MKSPLEIIDSIRMPEDKANHFIVGLYIFMLFGLLIHPIAGIAASFLAAVSKEIYDKLSGKGTPDIWDAIATSGGGFAGFICSNPIFINPLRS